MSGAFEGRTVVVTGSSRGLGRHFARLFAGEGAQVLGLARDRSAGAALGDELAAMGQSFVALEADVRDAASVERAIGEVVTRTGRLDVVVNNAGIALTKPALSIDDEEWMRVIDTDLSGAFRVARSAGAAMQKLHGGGAIVNVASVLALRVARQLAAYIAAKAALVKLTEALALEWASLDIRVNAIAPGYIETDLNRDFLHSPAGESIAKRVPMRRFGQPSDLDGAMLLLAGDAGRYITGATLTVDGGHVLAWL